MTAPTTTPPRRTAPAPTADALRAAVRYETVRLRTARSSRVVTLVCLVWAVIGGLSLGLQSAVGGEAVTEGVLVGTLTGAARLTGVPTVVALVAWCAVLATTDDLRTPLGVTTYVTVPRRGVLLAARTAVLLAWAVTVVLAVHAIGLGLGRIIGGPAVTEPLTAPVALGLTLGAVLTTTFWVAAGLLAGLLLRATAGAVVVLLLLPSVGEVLLTLVLVQVGLPDRVARWMPFRSAADLLTGLAATPERLERVAVVVLATAGFWLLALALQRRTRV